MNNQGSLKSNQSTNYEKRQKQNMDIKQKQYLMYESKKSEAENLKKLKAEQKYVKAKLEEEEMLKAQEKKNYLKAQKEMASYKVNEFYNQKFERAREETKKKIESERHTIKNYETEAQELERLEADLLRKLQETQLVEKQAFSQLETAMIDASIPKKMRVIGNQSQYSTGSQKSQQSAGGKKL